MRTFVGVMLSGLLWGTGAAQAEEWRSREGQCGEWRGFWSVQQGQDGVWTGSVQHEIVGGPCAQPSMRVAEGMVRAVIAGDHFFAAREAVPEGTVCSYFGKIDRGRARGVQFCEGSPRKLTFGIRLPSGEGGEDDPRPGYRAPR